MTHATHSTLIDYTYGDLDAGDAAQVTEHLRTCADCEAALDEWQTARASLATMLAEIDRAEPEEWDEAIETLYARRDNVVPLPVRRPMAWRWAAGIVLFAGSAAAFAALAPQFFNRGPASTTQETTQTPPSPATPTGGVVVEPVAGSVDIELLETGSNTRVEVSVTENDAVAVHSFGETAASFVAQQGRVQVKLNNLPASLRVQVPAHVAEARIRANGNDVAVVQYGRTHVINSNDAVVVVTGKER